MNVSNIREDKKVEDEKPGAPEDEPPRRSSAGRLGSSQTMFMNFSDSNPFQDGVRSGTEAEKDQSDSRQAKNQDVAQDHNTRLRNEGAYIYVGQTVGDRNPGNPVGVSHQNSNNKRRNEFSGSFDSSQRVSRQRLERRFEASEQPSRTLYGTQNVQAVDEEGRFTVQRSMGIRDVQGTKYVSRGLGFDSRFASNNTPSPSTRLPSYPRQLALNSRSWRSDQPTGQPGGSMPSPRRFPMSNQGPARPFEQSRLAQPVQPSASVPGQPEHMSVVFDLDVFAWTRQRNSNRNDIHVSQPIEVTTFSRDENRNIAYGSRAQLKQYMEPHINVSLKEKFQQFVPKNDEGDTGCEPILRALLHSQFDVDNLGDIVTFRNNLNKIGLTPYQHREEWEMDCVKVANTTFLDVRRTGTDPGDMDLERQFFMYYGYRFESLCTGESQKPTNANAEFCSISRLRLASHRILLCSEIDCTYPVRNGANPLPGYVELKTTKRPDTSRTRDSLHRHKYLKYWLQCFLGGVTNLVIGHRSDDGQLLDIERLKIGDLTRRSREYFNANRNARKGWSPYVCLNFLNTVLAHISHACHKYPGCTVRVRLNPSTKHIVGHLVAGPREGLGARIVQVRREYNK